MSHGPQQYSTTSAPPSATPACGRFVQTTCSSIPTPRYSCAKSPTRAFAPSRRYPRNKTLRRVCWCACTPCAPRRALRAAARDRCLGLAAVLCRQSTGRAVPAWSGPVQHTSAPTARPFCPVRHTLRCVARGCCARAQGQTARADQAAASAHACPRPLLQCCAVLPRSTPPALLSLSPRSSPPTRACDVACGQLFARGRTSRRALAAPRRCTGGPRKVAP